MSSNVSEIIKKTSNKIKLSENEITLLINAYNKNLINNEKMTEWLLNVYKNGLTNPEINAYTKALLNSGKKLNFSHLPGYIIDKHSTGGVGDKVSLILGPILAACGCYIPMIAGRGLGHTGGTIDKLESIPGYNCLLSLEKFSKIVSQIGISIISQTKEICPADGKIYALRDITNTIASFPLICGSIMSKKIAEGIQGLVLDIKTGNGSFMPKLKNARDLAKLLTNTGKNYNIQVEAIITDMNQPLGNKSGNWCEIQESISTLKGNGPKDLMNLVFYLGEKALSIAKIENPKNKIHSVISSGKAYEVFEKMIAAHNGNYKELTKYESPKHLRKIHASKSGYISSFDTKKMGMAIVEMGGGRKTITDKIDHSAGFNCKVILGQKVNRGELILELFCYNENKIEIALKMLNASIVISEKKPTLYPLIYT